MPPHFRKSTFLEVHILNTYKSEVDLINELVDLIDKLRIERDFSIYELANRSDVSANTIKHLFKRRSLPSIKTLCNICNGFEIPVWFLFYQLESFNSQPTESVLLLENYKKLSKRSKELLVELSKNLK